MKYLPVILVIVVLALVGVLVILLKKRKKQDKGTPCVPKVGGKFQCAKFKGKTDEEIGKLTKDCDAAAAVASNSFRLKIRDLTKERKAEYMQKLLSEPIDYDGIRRMFNIDAKDEYGSFEQHIVGAYSKCLYEICNDCEFRDQTKAMEIALTNAIIIAQQECVKT